MSDRDPFNEIERVFDLMSGTSGGAVESIPVDIVDEGDSYLVVADLPGFEREHIDVKLTDETTLYLGATRADETAEHAAGYVKRERTSQSVDRTVALPERVDDEGSSASYDAGVLRVTLPKKSPDPETGTDIPVS
jgi:HSP20 family protein